MDPLTPALLPQHRRFTAFRRVRREREASASQRDSVSNHAIPAVDQQMTTPSVDVAEMHDFKTLEPAAKAGNHGAEPGEGGLVASNAELNCSGRADHHSHSPATGKGGKLRKPSWRQLIKLRMGKKWQHHRKLIVKECLRRGISLNQPFCSYPYESQTDIIKNIMELVGSKYGWDQKLTRDAIRALCFDRARRESSREKKDQYRKGKQPKRAKADSPLFRVDLQSGTREITLYFSQDTSYACFKAAVFGNHLKLAPGEKLHYKARSDTEESAVLKPLMSKGDFITMLKMNPDVGVMLHVCPNAKLPRIVIAPEEATPTPMSEIDGTPTSPNPCVPTAEAISPVAVKLKSVRKPNTITNGGRARPSRRRPRVRRPKKD